MKKAEDRLFEEFLGRVGFIQRVLPAYRTGFFNTLAQACQGGLGIFAGKSRSGESINTIDQLKQANLFQARNLELFHPHATPYFLWQVGLYRWLNTWDPDVLVVEANVRYLSVRAAGRWMHKRDRPVIGWGLGVPRVEDPGVKKGKLINFQEKLWAGFLRSCDALIAYSRLGAQQYQQAGFPKDRVFVAPNAVAPRPKKIFHHRPPKFDGRPKVLFVGRLQARKRIDNLLKACASLPEDLQPQIWIIGDGPARGEFQSLAASIYPHTRFFGTLHGTALQSYFAQADLFVLPGTGGLAVQEAIAAGLPVIVAQGDGTQGDMVHSDGIYNGHGNGWLIPPDDVTALSRTLQIALSDVNRLRKMGAASYQIAFEEYNLENMVRVFLSAFSIVDVRQEKGI